MLAAFFMLLLSAVSVVQQPDLVKCKQSFQVTDDYPGHSGARGMYFGFHKECVEMWYGNSDWHNKKIDVTVENGPKGTIRLFKYNENCGKACGRWDPEESIQPGDWRMSDVIVKKSCEDGPILKDGACDCVGDPCTAGHWCYGGACFKNPKPCGTSQVEEEQCLCGETDNICFEGEYCFKGVCLDKLRFCHEPVKPKRALDIEPIMLNTGDPGLYFKFDLNKAKKFFHKSYPNRWNFTGTYTLINSCGETNKIYVMHNSLGCDKTDKRLQCGRLHPYAESNTGDWNYERKDKKQPRWIAFPEDIEGFLGQTFPVSIEEDVEVGDIQEWESSMNIMVAGVCAFAFFGGIYWGKKEKTEQTYSSLTV